MDKVYIIDYCMYNGDDILPFRLQYWYDYVAELVIVKSKYTFTGS